MLTEFRAAVSGGKLVARLLVAFALVAAGVAATLTWEYRSPWGLEAKRAALETKAAVNLAGWRAMTTDRDGWLAALGRCEAARKTALQAEAAAVSAASAARADAASGGFDQGYAAGRVAGRKSCTVPTGGTAHDPTSAPDPVGDLVAGRLRDDGDFAAGWNLGAYQPGGPPAR